MEQITEKIREVAEEILGVDSSDEPIAETVFALPEDFVVDVTIAPDDTGADYASNAAMKLFGLAKSGKIVAPDNIKSPRDLAGKFAKAMTEDGGFPFTVEVAGPGFLNFISSDGYWKQKLAEYGTNFQKNISQDVYSHQQVVCEFSDPNPFKVLHVGHLYTSIMGESISRLVEFAGGKVIRANFGGDVGLHVAKTIYAMLARQVAVEQIQTDDNDETATIAQKIQIIADCYVEGTREYEDNTDAKVEITRLNKLIYEIADAGPKKDWSTEKTDDTVKVAALYWAGRELSYKYFDNFYARVGVKFDKYYPESTVAKRGLKEVQEHIGSVYVESNGAIIFPGEKYGLHTRVFINNEGLPTYEAKDVGLIFTKWDDYNFDKSIVITGNDIIDYMKVVLCSVGQFAPELPARTEHITHGNVRLPGNEKMSSRKGNFIKAIDVLNDVGKALTENTTSGADVAKTQTISMAAIKYAFLKYKIGGNIEFDIKESVSVTGNSGVYLQYSGVRAKKILAAVMPDVASDADDFAQDWKLNEHEKSLIRTIDQYKDILAEAVAELAPHKIANYLYELAQEFSRFYENVKVTNSEYEAERVQIVRAYYRVLEHGLNILGIEIPEEM